MEGESVPPPSEMEVGNLAQDAVPVKSLVDYSADVQHHENRQDDMDQATSHYGNGNGNDQSENHESKEMEEKVREEPKSEPFDVFGKMLSSMPAKSPSPPPATSGDEDGKKDSFDSDDEKNENDNDANDGNDDSEEKKDVFDTMFDKEKETEKEDDKEDKPPATDDLDENETKPEEDSTKDDNLTSEATKDDSEDKKDTFGSGDAPAATTIAGDLDDTLDANNDDVVVTMATSDKILSDEKYYEELKPEQLEWLESNLPPIDSFYTKLCCTVCAKGVDPVIGSLKGVLRHPALGTAQCRACRQFYGDGDWPRTEDGDQYCRMCAQGGDILLCDKCPNAFCKKCLQRNLGSRALREITKSEEWACLVCDPTPIRGLQAIYMKVYKCQDEIKEKRAKDRLEAKAKKAKRNDVSRKEKEALVKSPKNFLEENISEAFKTLEVYQKALETERTRCIKTVKEGMSVVDATSITRKLRKLYAVTQKNMDLLDRAIVESFVENFPTESTRIHMGRVEPPPKYAAPAKRGAAKSKKKTQKSKVKIKPKKGKKGAAAKGKGKKGVIEMNGAPVYAEYDLPKKRKTYRESDVECIDVSEEDDSEYYNPKKRSKPGPASSKKSKPGPASKKKASYY